MAHNYGLRYTNKGQLWGIVACYFQLLGCPGRRLSAQFLWSSRPKPVFRRIQAKTTQTTTNLVTNTNINTKIHTSTKTDVDTIAHSYRY